MTQNDSSDIRFGRPGCHSKGTNRNSPASQPTGDATQGLNCMSEE